MLRWLGYKQVGVNTIVLPSDVKRRMKAPHVKELAKSIAELGEEPIHAPTIANRTRKLIAGRDRMAALMLNGAKACWVRLVEGTAQELADLEVDENLHRRHDNRDELIARRVAKVEGQIEAEIDAGALPDEMSGKSGRPKTPKGQARERVARELGTTPEAIRAAETRAAKDDDEPIQVGPLPPPVEIWGIADGFFPQGELDALRKVQTAIDLADGKLRAAQTSITMLKEGAGQVGHRVHALLYEHLHQVSDTVRRTRPAAVCPYCKLVPRLRPTCSGCSGVGYVGRDALDGIAPELTLGGPKAMVVDGKNGLVPISAARSRAPEREPIKPQPKAGKKLDIRLPDGNQFDADGEF